MDTYVQCDFLQTMRDSQNSLDSSNPFDLKGVSLDCGIDSESQLRGEHWVSFQTELPIPLQVAMVDFIKKYPNWDQYRLVQAALAGFLVQHGITSRSITRLYIGNMFNYNSFASAN